VEDLELENKSAVLETRLTEEVITPLYDSADLQGEVIAEIPKDIEIEVIDSEADFDVILIGNRKGYLYHPKEDDKLELEENNKQDNDSKTEENDSQEDNSNNEENEFADPALIEKDDEDNTPVSETEEGAENLGEVVTETEEPKTVSTTSITSTPRPFNSSDHYFKVTTDKLTVYMQSSSGLVSKGQLVKGQVYQRVDDIGNWHKIKFSDSYGYVWEASTIPVEKINFNSVTDSKPTNKLLQTNQDTIVYVKEGDTLKQIANVQKGVEFSVLQDYGNWLSVNLSGREGFIYKSNVETKLISSNYFRTTDTLPVYIKSGGSLVQVGKLEEGNLFVVKKESGNWLEIQYGMIVGYVWKGSTEYVAQRPANINTGSSYKDNKVRVVKPTNVYDNSTGTLVKIGELNVNIEYPVLSVHGNWFKVSYAGVIGYVHNSLVEQMFTSNIKYFEVTSNNPTVYDNRSGTLKAVGTLEKGQSYERIGDHGDWHKIKFSNFYGYIHKSGTKVANGSSIKNHSTGESLYGYADVKEAAVVYDNTSGSLVKFATINKGVKYPIVGVYGDWVKLDLADRYGFIYNKNLTITKVNVLKPNNYVNPKQTYTYEQMEKDLKEIQAAYPGLAQLTTIGKSVDGRNIYALKLGKGSTEILIHGAHHAREWITTNLVMEKMDQYAFHYAKGTSMNGYNVKDLLNKTSIWFVPMVNPDGVTLVQKGHTSAKNPTNVLKINGGSTDFSSWKANIRGVDLNRQYPAGWDTIVSNPGKPSTQNYKGPSPLSEPEAKAMYDFTNNHDFKTAISYHTSGQIIYWNYKQTGDRLERDRNLANMMKNKTGYSLVPVKSNPSGGGFNDWFLQTKRKPGFTPELSPYVGARPVPLSNFDKIWRENDTVGLLFAQEAYKNRYKW